MEKEKEEIDKLKKDIDQLEKDLFDLDNTSQHVECESLRRIQIKFLQTLIERARSQLVKLQQKRN